VQRARTDEDSWLQLAAIFGLTFYLCLEALYTHQLAHSVTTEILAVTALDFRSVPWNRAHLKATLKRRAGVNAREALTALTRMGGARK
jgi:hypothetical protein